MVSSKGCGQALHALTSSCVCIRERLVLDKGITCTEFKITPEYTQLMRQPCPKLEHRHLGAVQLGPVMTHSAWRTPTIKHACPLTNFASSNRAISNKVGPDIHVFERYSKWFKTCFQPEFLEAYRLDNHVISLNSYLEKFPLHYRSEILASMSADRREFEIGFSRYKAFPKIEMQFTEVPWDDKESTLNKVKERQICGPTSQKKAYANAFVNELEAVAHEHFDQYCGRKDWPDICATLNKHELNDYVWSEADGSGFDMTQLDGSNILVYDLMMACARDDTTRFEYPMTVQTVEEALKCSLKLRVSMDYGNIKYTTQGRASGDGWTTFANTMLMISYYRFTLEEAKVRSFALLVKGDDVLLGIEKEAIKRVKTAHAAMFTTTKHKQKHGLGQISDPLRFTTLENCSFLSNHFFRDSNGLVRMTRIPKRVIQTMSWTTAPADLNRPDMVELQQLAYSKGACLAAWASDLPIWGAIARCYMRLGRPCQVAPEYADQGRIWRHKPGTDRQPYLFYLEQTYGITHTEVAAIELQFDTCNSLYTVLHNETFDKFYDT